MSKKLLYGIGSVILLVTVILVGYYSFPKLNQPSETWKAAIVDQLSMEQNLSNATFVNASTAILKSSGYDVEIYSGQEVDIKFYQSLPSRGLGVILFRVHSAVRQGSDYVDLFTSERFVEGRYTELGDQISKATIFFSPETSYFAVGPTFIKQSLNGNFADTTIILMGCSGLNYTTIAEEFIRRGASVVVGWTNLVFPRETDHYITLLLQYLLDEDKQDTIKEAVDKINLLLERTPTLYKSLLHYYPSEKSDHIVPIRKESSLAGRMMINEVVQISNPRLQRGLVIRGLKL